VSGLDPLSGKVDGILVGEGFADSPYIQRLARRLPVVVIAGTLGAQAADVVAADNFSGAAALVTHLIADHGRRRLFHVGGPPDSPDAIQRRLALDHVLRGHPGCGLIGSAPGIFSVASGEQAAEQLLARHRSALPDAVVCANDQMAIGVLREFQRVRVAVPADVALTGFDDVYPSRLVDPPLTTVSQPLRDLGVRATQRLLARIENRALPPETSVLPTRVMIRASCGCQGRDTTQAGAETHR
jgi:DNA-binding LacI/PurR family transcriptional regulator